MKKIALLLAAFALNMGSALAAPVEFTFTSSIASSAIPGVAVGDTLTLTLLADNGGSSLASQTWTIGNLISGHLSVGSYSQSYTDGWFSAPGFVAFATDAAGSLTTTNFYGTTYSANHVDSFGSGPGVYLYSNAIQDHSSRLAYEITNLPTTSAWTVAMAPAVPEPETYAMLLAGVGLMGAIARRRQRK